MKYLKYLLGMFMIFSKDNCLSNLLSIIDFYSISHQNIKYLFYCILIKYPRIQC